MAWLRSMKLDPPGNGWAADLDGWAQQTAEDITRLLLELQPSILVRNDLEAELLLAVAGRAWYVNANCAFPVPDGVGVLGSGADVAYGAVHAALAGGCSPLDAARLAVTLACGRVSTCALVTGVMQVESIDP